MNNPCILTDVVPLASDNQRNDSSRLKPPRTIILPEIIRTDFNRDTRDRCQQPEHANPILNVPTHLQGTMSKSSQHSKHIDAKHQVPNRPHRRPIGTSSSEETNDSSTSSDSLQWGSVHLSSRRVSGSSRRDSSDTCSSEESCLDHRIPINYAPQRTNLRSSSYTGFGRKKTSILKFNEEYQRLDNAEWEHRNFNRNLKYCIGQPRPGISHRHQTKWSNHLNDFSLVQSSHRCCECRRKHDEENTYNQVYKSTPKLSFSPPNHRGFDPYVQDGGHFESRTQRMQVCNNGDRSPYQYCLSSLKSNEPTFFSSQNNLHRRSNNDEYRHSRIHSSRLWQRNAVGLVLLLT